MDRIPEYSPGPAPDIPAPAPYYANRANFPIALTLWPHPQEVAMRHIIRIFAILITLSATGCYGPEPHHPYRDEGTTTDYRNPDQHWSRGPHTDH
ncbi:hypothetical protein [Komagataeibacter europaeus]|nr:hypothetical protein [Komagataeibacter europaeus]GBQ41691.1 hypothetical protein AA18890_1241 [Komagataeibacter europaeus LMG 18890]